MQVRTLLFEVHVQCERARVALQNFKAACQGFQGDRFPHVLCRVLSAGLLYCGGLAAVPPSALSMAARSFECGLAFAAACSLHRTLPTVT